MKDQKAKFDGKKKGGDVAKASVQAVKQEETHREIQVIDMSDPDNIKKEIINIEEAEKMKGEDPCWKDYEMVGMKMKNGKKVPNCVPKNEEYEVIDTIEENYYDPKHPHSFSEHEYHTSHQGFHGYPLNHVTGKGTGSIKDHSSAYLKKAHEAHSYVVDAEYESAHPDNNDGEKNHESMAAHTHAKKAVNDIEKELKSRKVSVKHPIKNSHYKFESVNMNERTLTEPEAKKKEEVVMSMKKKLPSFKERYGDRAKEVIYATATKTAKEKA
jgi:hypothetical protein